MKHTNHNSKLGSGRKKLPTYNSVKVKVKVPQLSSTLCDPMDYIVHGILQTRILDWIAFLVSRGLLNPRIEPRSPALQADFLPAEPQGKPIGCQLKGL